MIAAIVVFLVVLPPLGVAQQTERKGEHQFQMEQQRALEMINDSTIAEFQQGIDLVKSGKYSEALAVFEGIAKQHPKNPVAYYNLGVTYKFLNNYGEASKMLRRACKLKKDPRYREQLNEVKRLAKAEKHLH